LRKRGRSTENTPFEEKKDQSEPQRLAGGTLEEEGGQPLGLKRENQEGEAAFRNATLRRGLSSRSGGCRVTALIPQALFWRSAARCSPSRREPCAPTGVPSPDDPRLSVALMGRDSIQGGLETTHTNRVAEGDSIASLSCHGGAP